MEKKTNKIDTKYILEYVIYKIVDITLLRVIDCLKRSFIQVSMIIFFKYTSLFIYLSTCIINLTHHFFILSDDLANNICIVNSSIFRNDIFITFYTHTLHIDLITHLKNYHIHKSLFQLSFLYHYEFILCIYNIIKQ